MITYIKSLKRTGNLTYEYNPLHNYQTNVDLYQTTTNVGPVIFPKGCAVNSDTGEILYKYITSNNNGTSTTIWYDKNNNQVTNVVSSGNIYATAGSLIDLTTDQLNFDLEHPVDIQIQPSYDGSVNLILNDDKNIPRLINSRFSTREKNTYEIVDRIGDYDTNIYNSENFNKDSSLYFQVEKNPKIHYQGIIKGVLPVGQYCFYFTYCDADDNESDIIAESGLIPAFIGSDKDPTSIDGGIKNQLSDKGISLKLSNLDRSYSFLKIYYVRYFADYQQNRVCEAKKIYQKYPLYNLSICYIQITGNEQTESIDPNILNITRFNPKNVLAQAQCKNMLFFGNIVKNTDNYKELTDCALRIIPSLVVEDFNTVDNEYKDINGSFGYYDSINIYNKVGYYPGEYYRFGVVFIYSNGTLSNVYNTIGGDLSEAISISSEYPIQSKNDDNIIIRNYIKVNNNGLIADGNVSGGGGSNLNAKGVCYIPEIFGTGTSTTKLLQETNKIVGIKFNIKKEIIDYLKTLGIRGLFFVRQKRIPNILAQCYLLPMDEELKAPILKLKAGGYTETFMDKNYQLTNDYESRMYQYSSSSSFDSEAYAAICPDFLLNQPYYNQIFNGSKFKIKKVGESELGQIKERMYSTNESYSETQQEYSNIYICSVTEDVPTVALQNKTYKLNIGVAEEAYRFEYAEINKSSEENKLPYNLVRGIYSPYLAIYSDSKLTTGALYNIYSNNQQDVSQEYLNRINSYEPFYAISDRYNFKELEGNTDKSLTCWRGDCYINTFTYRLNRNFQDPTLPNNDKIIQADTWTTHYYDKNNGLKSNTEWSQLSRADINAVQMGSWITFKVRSPFNYALRSIDHSHVSEEALMGSPRSFYPRSQLLYRGENKMPDSYLYNDAYRATLGYKCYFALNDINYLKDSFSNRIQYSAISIQDSYKNNYRESLSTYFRDYSQEYGSIQKLVGFEGYLLVVFEHAVALAVINERILAGGGDGEAVFINTHNVLPEELTIISDTYGTMWPESVIKSEAGYVYGVDTAAKKIWRVQGQQIEILSDFKVGNFLNDNINLSERDKTPIIGLRNVKTHYNNNKKDVMFTFYNNIYSDEEKAWNLCYNELLGEFVTFYSWIPSYSENIDTQFFSFDRDTSKILSLLKYSQEGELGITCKSTDQPSGGYYYYEFSYNKYNSTILTQKNKDNTVENKYIQSDKIENISGYKVENDHQGFYKAVEHDDDSSYKHIKINKTEIDKIDLFNKYGIVLLVITPYYHDNEKTIYYQTETVAIDLNKYLEINDDDEPKLKTDFYLHGNAGIIDCQENLYPTYWYGEFHPFEFEFVVNDKIGQQKIFTNLILISNKAEPESFHFEIEGDNYEFSSDKRTMYFRQEATKNLYQNLGSDILYDRYFTDVMANKYTYEQYYRGDGISPYNSEQKNEYSKYKTNERFNWDRAYPVENSGLVKQVKSTIFSLYYNRVDTYNEIYHKYTSMNGGDFYDFKNLSGSEIIWDRVSNQFNIVTHIKNSPIDRVGRVRGNSRYKEGKWNIQIPSIQFCQSNEKEWVNIDDKIKEYGSPLRHFNNLKIPPIVINSDTIPSDLTNNTVQKVHLPNIYCDATDWKYTIKDQNQTWTARKETKIRDKWMKVRVRYSGKNLAVIHSIITLYNISYS